MEKRNVYKAKSVCQPVLGIDLAILVNAAKQEREYWASVKTVSRQGVSKYETKGHSEYRKTEHGNISI